MKDEKTDFNFDDFIASSGGIRNNYLCHGLSGGGFENLGNLSGWETKGGEEAQRRPGAPTEGYSGLYGNLEEWKHRAAALFNKDFGVIGGLAGGGIATPTALRGVDGQPEQRGYNSITEMLRRSQNLLDLQNRHAVLQALVNVKAINSREELSTTTSSSPDEETKDQQESTTQRRATDDDGSSALKVEEGADATAVVLQGRQTEILNALIHNLIHQDRHEASTPGFNAQSETARTQSCGPPTWSLLQRRNDNSVLKHTQSIESDAIKVKASSQPACSPTSSQQPQLTALLQAVLDHYSDSQTTTVSRTAKNRESHSSDDSTSEGVARTGANKAIQTLTTVNGNSKIRFGRGWLQEVDVGLLNGDPFSDISSSRSSLDDEHSEFSFVLPISGRVCVVRLQWAWDGGSFDEDVLWDMTENGSSIDVFVESYIREMGLPRTPVGTQLLQSFRRQVEAARSFESMFEVVCRHLLIKLGHSNVKQLPGITRKIIIDCLHEVRHCGSHEKSSELLISLFGCEKFSVFVLLRARLFFPCCAALSYRYSCFLGFACYRCSYLEFD